MDNCPKCNRPMRQKQNGYHCRRCSYYKPLSPRQKAGQQRAEESQQPEQEQEQQPQTHYYTHTFRSDSSILPGIFFGLMPPETVPAAPVPEMEQIAHKLDAGATRLVELMEEREYYLSMALTLFHQRKIRAHFDGQIEAVQRELADFETRYAVLRDTLHEPPALAEERDALARRLLAWDEQKE